MDATIKIYLKNTVGEFIGLSKPGRNTDAKYNDVSLLKYFERFKAVCEKNGEHDNMDMSACAALLFEMQIKENVPDEYTELSERFVQLVKENKKLDPSERRDYVFFAYELMREIEKLENRVYVENQNIPDGILTLASQDDDISAIGIVNNSDNDMFVNVEINGLPGRHTAIDYYRAGEYEPLSVVCNTDTKLSSTTVMIALTPYTVHLFKIR